METLTRSTAPSSQYMVYRIFYSITISWPSHSQPLRFRLVVFVLACSFHHEPSAISNLLGIFHVTDSIWLLFPYQWKDDFTLHGVPKSCHDIVIIINTESRLPGENDDVEDEEEEEEDVGVAQSLSNRFAGIGD